MAAHVYARLSGYGLVLVPYAPYSFTLLEDGRSVSVTHAAPGGTRSARITPGKASPALHLEPGTASLDEVVTLSPDGQPAHWRIETQIFTCAWPRGFTLHSAQSGPFDLLGPDGSLIYLQGPYPPERVPPMDKLVIPGQTLMGQGKAPGFRWVEVAYTHEGQRWHQRYVFASWADDLVLVVTSQALARHAVSTAAATDALAASLRPFT